MDRNNAKVFDRLIARHLQIVRLEAALDDEAINQLRREFDAGAWGGESRFEPISILLNSGTIDPVLLSSLLREVSTNTRAESARIRTEVSRLRARSALATAQSIGIIKTRAPGTKLESPRASEAIPQPAKKTARRRSQADHSG